MTVSDSVVRVDSPIEATVAHVVAMAGATVAAGDPILYLEIMKMEQIVSAPVAGTIDELLVSVGDLVTAGQAMVLLAIDTVEREDLWAASSSGIDDARTAEPRADLEALHERRAALRDDARPAAVQRRREAGHRTARENIADLVDGGSFNEYGGLAVAAQRLRRGLEELIERTPADGLVTGVGTVNAELVDPSRAQVAVAAYDYTVLAGTQGWVNHLKKDRLFELAARNRLPVVVFAEGGGGRPGDTDVVGGAWLDAAAFQLFAQLSGKVPLVSIVNGRCFAGNAALAGCADVIIATESSNLGMAGPAMVEGGGLGSVTPEDIGPIEVQRANGVVDVVVRDEAEAVDIARRYLSYTQGPWPRYEHVPQDELRHAVPENRKRVYDMRTIVETIFDTDSVLELRREFAPGMVTAFARLEGAPVGVIANVPAHLGGAIDADGADLAARHLQLCESYGLPVVVLCDTPGFMVGPQAETQAGVRRFSRMFVAGANLSVPIVCVITRKAYGLGAQAMMGGHIKAPILTVAWPTGELGPMGLEGAVRLGMRRQLEEIIDEDERQTVEAQMIDLAHANAKALNIATFAEIDDVIDPAETRSRVAAALRSCPPPARTQGRFVDTR